MVALANHMNPPTLLTLFLFTSLPLSRGADAGVRVVHTGARHQLLRNGQPYFIRGGGGNEQAMKSIAAAGGNSLRLWGDDHLGEALEAAQQAGVTITAGIWLGQVRQGFDWSNADSLAKQREHVRATVLKYKDHPALLVWALGNEMEDAQGRNEAVWTGINNLATLVHELDPHHPAMTVIAEVGGEKVKNLHRLCPAIDIVGINSYAGAVSVGERYKKFGGTKPYILTEYGPAGAWETAKDALGAYPEATSTAKAGAYRAAYEKAVLHEPGVCLGSYAFLWGQKQEVTATWFSMFTGDGARLAAVDALTELWTGKAPANRCPEMISLKLEGAATGAPGGIFHAKLAVSDRENDALKVTWLLQRDSGQLGTGGDREQVPPTFPEAIMCGNATGAEVRLPQDGGLYRLFATVRDDHGGAAVGNVVLRVNAPMKIAKPGATTLPLAVYADEAAATFIPAGWMGDAKSIKLDPAWTTKPQSGKTCLRCEFAAEQGWGGVVWQSPANDWGDQSGGYDLTGAKKLTFWARGEAGGEVVDFKFGIIPQDKKFPDTGKGALEKIALTADWQHYEIATTDRDLTRIKTGFVWSVASNGKPIVFYLDNIRWE